MRRLLLSARAHADVARRIAAAALAVVLLSTVAACHFDGAYDLPLPAGVNLGNEPFQVTAEFRDVISLVPKSEVQVDDVPVGVVTDVRRSGWHAEVTMQLQKGVRLPDNAIAEIRQTSLLGEKYVALLPPPEGGTGTLSDGDHIPLARTGRNPEVEEVLGALSLLLHGGGIAQLQTISHELNAVMNGRQQRIGDMFRQLDTLIGSLDHQRAQIFRAMDALNRLTRTLNAERRTFTDALDTMGPALRELADQRNQLVGMLKGLSRLGQVGTRVINRTSDNTLAALRHLQPIVARLVEAGSALPRAIELIVSFPFPRQALQVIKGDYANTSARVDLDIGQLYHNFSGGKRLPVPKVQLPDVPLPGDHGGPALPNLPNLPTPSLPTPRLPGLHDLRRLCEHAPRHMPSRLDGSCNHRRQQHLNRHQIRLSIRRICALPGLDPTRVVVEVCGRQRSGRGGLLDGLPGGAVGDQGGLLSGGLG